MLQLRQSIRRKDKEKNVETEADHARPPALMTCFSWCLFPLSGVSVTLSLYDDFPCSAVRHLDDVDALCRS